MAAAGVDLSRRPRGQQRCTARSGTACRSGVLHHRHHFGVVKKTINPTSCPAIPRAACCPRISTEPPGEYGSGDKRVQAYCFRMCLTDDPGEPRAVPQARGLRPQAVRTAAARLRRRLARDVRQVRPDPQPQDRHQQPRPVQHRQHRHELRLSRGQLRAPPRDHPGARDLPEGLLYFIANDPRVPEDVQDEDADVGPGRRTSSPTTATGRTRSTSARPGA